MLWDCLGSCQEIAVCGFVGFLMGTSVTGFCVGFLHILKIVNGDNKEREYSGEVSRSLKVFKIFSFMSGPSEESISGF